MENERGNTQFEDCMVELDSSKKKIDGALHMIASYGTIDGDHHKMWLLDQLVRLLSKDYDKWVKDYQEVDRNGENQYEWDEGIAP